jgi:tetratricopeptide (TPR) repeat protein
MMDEYSHSTMQSQKQPVYPGIIATAPAPIDPALIAQRTDEVSKILRMLTDKQASALMLLGASGAGRSTVAALLYYQLILARRTSMSAPRHLIWLEIGPYTTLPDIISAILDSLDMRNPHFHLLKPEQQIATLLYALRRPQEAALIILDRFEWLLSEQTPQEVAIHGQVVLFLEMLLADLGPSRILLTAFESPYEASQQETRVKSYRVSPLTMPEGVALLQQRGVQGLPHELSTAWQRCRGQIFALVLLSTFIRLSGVALNYLLDAPDYQAFWTGDTQAITTKLIAAIYQYLTPMQHALLRTLCLFSEPVSLPALILAVTGNEVVASRSQSRTFAALQHELGTLAQHSLVQISFDKQDNTAFVMHTLLSQYVLEHYLDSDEQNQHTLQTPARPASKANSDSVEALQTALAAGHMQVVMYYRQQVQQHCPPIKQRKSLQDVEPLLFVIRHLTLAHYPQQAYDLLFQEKLYESLVQWGAWHTLIALYISILSSPGELSRQDEATVCGQIGMLYGRLGHMQQSNLHFQEALTIQRELGDRRGEAMTLVNLGELQRTHGDLEQAHTNLQNALVLSQEDKDLSLQYIVFHNLGLLYQGRKDYDRAFSFYVEALRLAYKQRNRWNEGLILTNLGLLLFEQGLQKEGVAVLLVALDLRKALQDTTVVQLELFLKALEQKIGTVSFTQLCQEARAMQQQVMARFASPDMRQ